MVVLSLPLLASAQTTTRQFIAPGVTLIQEVIPDGTPDGPLVISLLEIDVKKKGVYVNAALGQDRVWGKDATLGREIVSTLAARHKATAAINAGFFPFAGNPIGLHIQQGELVTEPTLSRTCFLLTKKEEPLFEAFVFSGQVKTKKEGESATFKLSGLNRRPGKGDDLLLFTPIFFDKTLKSAGRTEVVLSGVDGPFRANETFTGKVAAVGEGGATPIAPGTVVLSGSGAGAEFLQKNAAIGAKLSFQVDLTTASGQPFEFSAVREAIAAGPRLLTEGKVTITTQEEGFPAAFSTARHPRTAIGATKDGKLLMVVVDGRQKGVSRGMSLPELADLLLKYGARNAVNLDGGGSTTAIVRDLIVNSPSEGKERPVANALLVFAPLPDIKEGDRYTVPPQATVPLLFPGDHFTSDPSLTGKKGVWGVTGGIGFVSQTGAFTAVRPGSGTICFLPDRRQTRIRIPIMVSVPVKTALPESKAESKESAPKEPN